MRTLQTSHSSKITINKFDEKLRLKSPYLNGKKNDDYISPLYSSNLFPQTVKNNHPSHTKNSLSIASTKLTLNKSSCNLQFPSPTRKKNNKTADFKNDDLSISTFRYYRELPNITYFSPKPKLNLNVVHPYVSPVIHTKKELCTSCYNNEIINNMEEEDDNKYPLTSEYFKANDLNKIYRSKDIEEKIINRKKITEIVSNTFVDNTNKNNEKIRLQEKQREYPYFMFNPNLRDHQVERAKIMAEYKERIQKNYLYKYYKEPVSSKNTFIFQKYSNYNIREKNDDRLNDTRDYFTSNQKEKIRKYRVELMEQIALNNANKEVTNKTEKDRDAQLINENMERIHLDEMQTKLENDMMKKKILQDNRQYHKEKIRREKIEKENEIEFNTEQIIYSNNIQASEEKRNKLLKDEGKINMNKSLIKQINEKIEKKLKEKDIEKKRTEKEYFYSHYEKELSACEGCSNKVPFRTKSRYFYSRKK